MPRLENFTVHRYLIAMELTGSSPDLGRGAAEIGRGAAAETDSGAAEIATAEIIDGRALLWARSVGRDPAAAAWRDNTKT
jgi:hypothetical protein